MKTIRIGSGGAVAAIFVLNGLSPAAAGATVWDLADDWSDTQNPNGPWSYNAGASPIPTNFPNWAGSGNPAWAAAPSGFGHIPVWAKLQVDPVDYAAQVRKAYKAMLPAKKMGVARVGRPAPDFSAVDTEGRPFTLSSHIGKRIVVITFQLADW